MAQWSRALAALGRGPKFKFSAPTCSSDSQPPTIPLLGSDTLRSAHKFTHTHIDTQCWWPNSVSELMARQYFWQCFSSPLAHCTCSRNRAKPSPPPTLAVSLPDAVTILFLSSCMRFVAWCDCGIPWLLTAKVPVCWKKPSSYRMAFMA